LGNSRLVGNLALLSALSLNNGRSRTAARLQLRAMRAYAPQQIIFIA